MRFSTHLAKNLTMQKCREYNAPCKDIESRVPTYVLLQHLIKIVPVRKKYVKKLNENAHSTNDELIALLGSISTWNIAETRPLDNESRVYLVYISGQAEA